MSTTRRALTAFVLVSAFAIGCDSTQPDRVGSRTASLTFETRALANLWACYESPSRTCFMALDSSGIPRKENRTIPWNYSLRITIIRAGAVTEELVTSVSGLVGSSLEPNDLYPDFVNLTNYDFSTSNVPDRVVGGVTYTDGHLVSSASPIYLSTVFIDPGPTNLLDIPPETPTGFPAFEFTMNTGDTVVVRARKQLNADGPPINPPFQDIALIGTLTLEGIAVPLLGSFRSPTTDGAGTTFSFTVQ